MRVLKLIVRANKLVIIYRTLANTAPILGSFVLLMLVFLFMFTVVAVQNFALIDLSSIPGLDREMGYHANFRNFPAAFLTLFRCSTGEAWNTIMFESSW